MPHYVNICYSDCRIQNTLPFEMMSRREQRAAFETGSAVALFEELLPGRRSNGEYRGMLQFPFRTDCIELSSNLVRGPDCPQRFLTANLRLRHRRKGKYSRPGFAKCAQQRKILEFA